MCGFVAAIGDVDIQKSLPFIHHRGIRHQQKSFGAGNMIHVRLPIVGLGEEYDQPIMTKHFMLGFVGELLDFREKYPTSKCDTEVVCDIWNRYGPQGFTQHDGFWSIAVIDNQDRLHLFCDYLAQKPTYYRTDIVAASSEIAAIQCLAPTTIDADYMNAVVRRGYCWDVRSTPFNEIKKVLPGEYVILGTSRQIVDHLRPLYSFEDLKAEIFAAVRRRVESSDVPVACLLSGGLDSSIVYEIAKRYGDVIPYYVSERGDPNPEERQKVLSIANNVNEVYYDKADWREAMMIMQEPIDLGSLLPQVALSRSVKETVCLTGDGADEFFGGYRRAYTYDSQSTDVWKELIAWHLPRLDRVMMRNCIEVRSPFLARRVAGIALGLPWEERRGKAILKNIFREMLPEGIADQPKIPLKTKYVGENNTKRLIETFLEIYE